MVSNDARARAAKRALADRSQCSVVPGTSAASRPSHNVQATVVQQTVEKAALSSVDLIFAEGSNANQNSSHSTQQEAFELAPMNSLRQAPQDVVFRWYARLRVRLQVLPLAKMVNSLSACVCSNAIHPSLRFNAPQSRRAQGGRIGYATEWRSV